MKGLDKYCIPAVIMHLVSLFLCGRLMYFLIPQVPAQYRSRLRFRQLYHLAAADSGAAFFALFDVLTETLVGLIPDHGEGICNASRDFVKPCVQLCLTASVLIEMHLALGMIVGKTWRPLLERTLIWVWPLSAAAVPIDVFAAWHLDTVDYNTCKWINDVRPYNSTPVLSTLALIAIVINSTAYSHVWCAHETVLTPGSVTLRARRQLWRYCVSMLVTWVPYWVLFLYGTVVTRGDGDNYVAMSWAGNLSQCICITAIASNGSANYYSYAVHNRQLRNIWRGSSQAADSSPPHTHGSLDDSGCPVPSPQSFHVLFDPYVDEYDDHGSVRSSIISEWDGTSLA